MTIFHSFLWLSQVKRALLSIECYTRSEYADGFFDNLDEFSSGKLIALVIEYWDLLLLNASKYSMISSLTRFKRQLTCTVKQISLIDAA